jgi:hypothetical protein
MSTKNLARTVIESGRRNVWERRFSHREERAELRHFKTQVKKDPYVADAQAAPRIRPVRPEFGDKLNPTRRWMASRAGRQWADVKSELHKKFAGPWPVQHVIYQHMLKDVSYVHEVPGYGLRGWRDHVVTDDGVLQPIAVEKSRYPDNRRRIKERFTYRSEEGIRAWLKERRIEEVHGVLVWLVPLSSRWEKCHERYGCGLQHRVEKERIPVDTSGYSYRNGRDYYTGLTTPTKLVEVRFHKMVYSWKRGEKLNDRERQYWKTLSPEYKTRILEKKF